mgnify:CR=1 FL=1
MITESSNHYMDRKSFLRILEIALQTKSYRFLRQSSELWLEQYPGDLLVSLWRIRGLFAEGKRSEVLNQLEELISYDPEFLEAYQLLEFVLSGTITERFQEVMACIHALGGRVRSGISLPEWSGKLLEARKAVDNKDADGAMHAISLVLGRGVRLPLIDATHIRCAALNQDKVTVKQLAEVYHSRWQRTLQFQLYIADGKLEMGDEAGAIELLHQCAAMDAAGQVAARIWGKDHPYRPLFVQEMRIPFDLPIPAQVASKLGLNQLPAQVIIPQRNDIKTDLETPLISSVKQEVSEERKPLIRVSDAASEEQFPEAPKKQEKPVEESENKSFLKTEEIKSDPDDFAKKVEMIFDRIAVKLKQPKLGNVDGRFPTYVIITSKTNLHKKYGPMSFSVIDSELQNLSQSIKHRHGWDSLVLYPDDPGNTAKYGIEPIDVVDPWKIKHLLATLDNALRKRGAMIGALLIIGGPDIIPFHRLPNPAGDMDTDVPSDNPYGTLSSNYFLPEYPVGRLPDENGNDAGLLLGQIRRMSQTYHPKQAKSVGWRNVFDTFGFLVELIRVLLRKNQQTSVLSRSFGYTAAIWQRSSIAVFRPIGQAHKIHVSPPIDANNIKTEIISGASLEYFNLHGIEHGADWYGQKDVANIQQSGPDYPVALSPSLIQKNGRAPQVIFSEACFGGNIFGKSSSDAIVLKFISIGTEIIAASTCTAYGSVSTPLIGADLLGYLFWKYLLNGYSAGEALMFAKIDYAKEMHRRQGYLDGEDQKTLLSFVLYGDPMAVCKGIRVTNTKGSLRQREVPQYHLISENQPMAKNPRLPESVLGELKTILSPYLPGLVDDDIQYLRQNLSQYEFHDLPEKPEMVAKSVHKTGNVVMRVQKEYRIANQIHRHYARVTMNSNGKLMKVVVSR